ncbi:MAG: acyl-ACP--UDP-N-acetylglucosamine O-acyltransferase [Burkholderiales bacterium]|jgi:UDP-N-acetylglucosamine acyltransferase|nr:acyl-ACP--UDP-N-acetylglucosamine O-acyltransferase [Burkholderiales bacterium]
MSKIHPSAIVDPSARIADDVEIGPFCVIGANVEIAAGTRIGAHVVINGPTRIGRDNRIHAFAAVGGDPQDKKFADEATLLEIGDRNTIREFVTINRGTVQDGGITRIGDDNWIMAYVHIAHDCVVGSNTIFANAASLAGHVKVDDWVILGGFTLVHQFCQIGAHAFTSMGAIVNRDVPPYVTVAGNFAEPKGINSEGLKRRGYSSERIMDIKRAYKTLYKSGLPLAEARSELANAAREAPDVQLMLDFIARSERSLIR